jgi:Fanconi anemia group J protein
VAQVIGELKKTSYRPRTCVLASRDFYCINGAVKQRKDRDAECRRLLAENRCRFAEGAERLVGNKALRENPWDVEELVTLGRKCGACPYLAAKAIAQEAEFVVCPYNYLLDWKVREALSVRLKGAVVVVDEAHNISDSLMEASSCDVDLVVI